MDGSPLREHLLHVQKQTGRTLSELVEPEIPEGAAALWGIFLELHSGRRGKEPLAWQDLHAWQQVSETRLTPAEANLMLRMDCAALEALNGRD